MFGLRPTIMASTTNDREAALRASLLDLLHHTTHGMESAGDIAGAISSALAVVRATMADFAEESNRTRPSVRWNRLPPELKLETTRWLLRREHRTMLGVSRNMRGVMIADTSQWTKISLPDFVYDDAERAEFLQTMAPRSGNRPVDLDWVSKCVPGPDAARDAILAILLRARTLVLHSSYFDASRSGARTFWTEPSPLLERLTITDGKPNSYITLDPSWPAKEMPRLREVKVDAVSFHVEPSSTPFARVVRLEATMTFRDRGECWAHIWLWFPRLKHLVAHVENLDNNASIPPPPDSLRYLTLIGGYAAPACVVRAWRAHCLRALEIHATVSDSAALSGAVEFLQNCEPSLWTASFVRACCPEDRFPTSIILRGARTGVVVRLGDNAHGAQIRGASSTVLFDKIETLTLGGPAIDAMLELCPMMPVLRTLNMVGAEWKARLAQRPRPTLLRAPGLQRLVVDVTDPPYELRLLPTLLSSVGSSPGLHITFRCSAALQGRISVASTGSAPFDVEFAPCVRQHDYGCVLYRGE